MYLLAINCGSSSIKGKLYGIPSSKSEPPSAVADLSVSNISSKGEKVKIKVGWEGGKGKNVDEEGEDGGSVECKCNVLLFKSPRWLNQGLTCSHLIDSSLVPLLLERLESSGKLEKDDIKYITHRV